jgi:hypothetical protein
MAIQEKLIVASVLPGGKSLLNNRVKMTDLQFGLSGLRYCDLQKSDSLSPCEFPESIIIATRSKSKMSLMPMFLVYVIVFRLAIIATGTISIVLGYRLFRQGILSTDKASVEAKLVGSRFILKNAAPGTSFALFGALVVLVMLFQGSPALTLETVKRAAAESGTTETAKVTLRGNESDTLSGATLEGLAFEQKGDPSHAIVAYERAISTMAEPLNDLAWLYVSDGRLEEAASLSELAVEMREDPRFLDTRAEIKFKTGDRTSAIKLMERAVRLDPSRQFRDKLERFKNAKP